MAKKRSTGTGMGALAVFGVVAAVGGLSSLVIVRAMNKPQTYLVKGVQGRLAGPVRHVEDVVTLNLSSSGDPLVHDVDEDYAPDFIVYDAGAGGGLATGRYTAIDTRNDRVIWRTPSVEPPSEAGTGRFAWIAEDNFLVTRDTSLFVHALDSGRRTQRIDLGARATRPCASAPGVVARVSLPLGDVEVLPNGTTRRATGECLPVDTDGFELDRGPNNGRATVCDASRPECLKRLEGLVPQGFEVLEVQRVGSRDLVFGKHKGEAVLMAIDASAPGRARRVLWTSTLAPPRTPADLVPDMSRSISPSDPAFSMWRAADRQLLVFRNYAKQTDKKPSGGKPKASRDDSGYRTAIEGLDPATGRRTFFVIVQGRVRGVHREEGDWILSTGEALLELHGADGAVRRLTGRD